MPRVPFTFQYRIQYNLLKLFYFFLHLWDLFLVVNAFHIVALSKVRFIVIIQNVMALYNHLKILCIYIGN